MASPLKNPGFLATIQALKSPFWRCNELNYLGWVSILRQAATLKDRQGASHRVQFLDCGACSC